MTPEKSSQLEDRDRYSTKDVIFSAIPLPSDASSSSCSAPAEHLDAAASYRGSGGTFSGAGATDGWSNCDTGDVISSAAESTSTALVDAISSFSPF
jgi:hypothetical protein